MRKVLLLLVLACVASPAFGQDFYVKIKTHSDATEVMGQSQPARDDESEQWFSGTKLAQVDKDTGFIVDLDKNMAYLVNHKDKSYVEMPMPIDYTKVLPPEAQALASMLQVTATVSPTTETKKIGSWDCTGYDATLSMMGTQMKLRVWASPNVPGNLTATAAKLLPVMLQAQLRLDSGSMKEFEKIQGFQVATELTADIMGTKMHRTTEAVEIAQKEAPAGIYAPPAGYTKKATLSMQDLQRR